VHAIAGCASEPDGGVEVLAGIALQPKTTGLAHPPPPPSLAGRPASDPKQQDGAVPTRTSPAVVVQAVFRVAGRDAVCVCVPVDQALGQATDAALVCGAGTRQSEAEKENQPVVMPVICLRAARGGATLAEAGAVSGGVCLVDVLVGRAAGMDDLGMRELDELQAQIKEQLASLARVIPEIESEACSGAAHRFTETEDDKELFRDLFDALDTDKSGFISQAEIEEAL
jgi:hypothetical protein